MEGPDASGKQATLKQLEEIEALIERWKDVTDPETLWALSLLRHTAAQIRRELRMPPTNANG